MTRGPSDGLMSSNTPPQLTARLIEAEAAPRRRESVAPSRPDEAAHAERSTRAGHALTEGPDLTYYAARQLDVYPTL
ncbi:MAG TPA: hypothetical protein VGO08_11655, partial [Burkholderiales bacterium]|nr:hypothetical protein [Burkholderiales bacterium]